MKQTVRDIDVKAKRVLIRADFNVPLDNVSKRITDDTRIRESLPTIQYCLEQGASIVLASHLGRPDGNRVPSFSLAPVAVRLSELLHKPVIFLDDCIGPDVEARVMAMKPGEIILLENLRFYAQEEKNDAKFAQSLSLLGQVFVNDAFGTAHRAHASTEGVARHLPAVAGFLMEKEIKYLDEALSEPARPYVAILGGAKVSDKIGVVNRLLEKVDKIIVGGGMANTFLKAKGLATGSSRVESDKLDLAKQLLAKAQSRNIQILLPVDQIVTTDMKNPSSPVKIVEVGKLEDGWEGVDIGPKSAELFAQAVKDAKTVIWNGPLGVFEQERFAAGSRKMAEALAALKATTVIGGGDTAACVQQFKLAHKMSHISTGGGASLEFLEGKVLPGIAVLQDKRSNAQAVR